MDITFRRATAADFGAVRALLEEHRLPLAGIPDNLEGFFVAEEGSVVVGVAGLERYGPYALLRSVAVAEQGRGTGAALVRKILGEAQAHGTEAVFLLTTTAEGYFPRFGFTLAERDDVPEALQASAEFRGACPSSATLMVRR